MKNQRTLLIIVSAALLVVYLFSDRLEVLLFSNRVFKPVHRFGEVFQAVEQLYFEEIESDGLVDDAIEGMLYKLDPHTVYIPAERMDEVTQQFDGEFEGIGIEFILHEGYPIVVSPIADSPSEKIGLRSGDKIIRIEGESAEGITEAGVREKLLGPKGTEVNITIDRSGLAEPFDVTIERDRIPVFSVTSRLMLDDSTGYIRVGRFARTTDDEFEEALRDLESQNMRRLILDLRGNSGGILDQAVKMADKFLDDNKRIVYTRGRIASSNEDYYATTGPGTRLLPVIIMIDRGTASASEIVAGAIQDWDRGLIVGETSFGKGLVQQQIRLDNGASVRVSVARYYTPSGRLIQRPYGDGKEEYYAGADGRSGEAADDEPENVADTTQVAVYKTNKGRQVRAGGGISPDVEITAPEHSMMTVQFLQNRLFFEFVNEKKFEIGEFDNFRDSFVVDDSLMSSFLRFARSRDIEVDDDEVQDDSDLIRTRIKSEIARSTWGSTEYHEIRVRNDRQLKQAVELFPEAVAMASGRDEK